MRRLALVPLVLLLLAPSATAARPRATSWAQPEIKAVTSAGLMGGDAATFRPDAPLTKAALATLVAGLTQEEAATPRDPAAPVTMAQLDAALVAALDLGDAAQAFAKAARDARLGPPARFGTEAVARLLGLRTNHPTVQDSLELLPRDAATRAEAAYSAAQILRLDDWAIDAVREAALSFSLPELTPWQTSILREAISFIGYPYVWGGTSEGAEAPFGVPARGGFDCSGFVWRVYKLQRYAGAPRLAGVIRGRTTMEMSGEVAKARRIHEQHLAPGDVLFFGERGPRAKPAQVDHAAIYLGNGWFIHSSRYGVALAQLAWGHESRLAWARRPLAEAGVR